MTGNTGGVLAGDFRIQMGHSVERVSNPDGWLPWCRFLTAAAGYGEPVNRLSGILTSVV
jgi:hypothetical protein